MKGGRMAARYPRGLPRRYRRYWDHPWRWEARFIWLQRNGYLSPNFTLREAASKDGTPIPRRLLRKARNHAFNLEVLRHRLGDVSMPVLSWYRSPAHNAAVGGASRSQHMNAVATDFTSGWVERVGRTRVLREGERVFSNGGMGVYPAGSVHFDSRGFRARWTSF
jgi:zinc D-Ala-D-Ala carboxypeptidase